MAGSSPGAFSQVCIGFADILALRGGKTIQQYFASGFIGNGMRCTPLPGV
jgi:hypothetical protein